MFGRKKEKQVNQDIKKHLLVVIDTVKSMVDAVDAYLKGKTEESDSRAYATHNLESKADELRRKIIADMYKGAFFPSIREDLINYLARQDKVADSAESCCDFLIAQKPRVPEEFSSDILNIARLSYEAVIPLKKAVENYFQDNEAVRAAIHTVNCKEENADTVEWHLTEKIFLSKDLSLAEKIHLREFVYHLVHISDLAEDAADMLESVIIKRNV